MAIVKVTRNFQVSIPRKVRESLGIREGDLVEIEQRDGELVLTPKRVIAADQAWFWTPEWQAGEREVEEDKKAGRVSGPFDTIEELRKHLES